MGTGVDLLRMLEPVVRPCGLSGPTKAGSPKQPIEVRSFDSLLEEARAADEPRHDEASGSAQTGPAKANPLAELARMDRIENPSLRLLIGGEGAKA